MYVSGEIRWFLPGRIPSDISDWFRSSGLGVDEPERVDEYLLLPGCTTTGVKIRDGRFEVKTSLLPPVPVTYTDRVDGIKDAWIKWSREARDSQALRDQLVSEEDAWVSVSKRRQLRLFSLNNGGAEEIRPRTVRLARGCQIELSSIRWQGENEWWSLSLEAFGAQDELIDNLDEVARQFFKEEPPLRLTREASMSYPAWLLAAQETGA